ncbi:Scramblase like protein, partial [Aduncisulcus paluster]
MMQPGMPMGQPMPMAGGMPAQIPMPAPIPSPASITDPLQYLQYYPALGVMQQKSIMEIMCGCDANQEYEVVATDGRKVLKLQEESNACCRFCCGPSRPFEAKVVMMTGQEICRFNRPFRCFPSCCWCCWLQLLEAFDSHGAKIGEIKQLWSIFNREFQMIDEVGNPKFDIMGPM